MKNLALLVVFLVFAKMFGEIFVKSLATCRPKGEKLTAMNFPLKISKLILQNLFFKGSKTN